MTEFQGEAQREPAHETSGSVPNPGSSAAGVRGPSISAHLQAVENQLNMLLEDLAGMRNDDQEVEANPESEREELWTETLEGFRVKATTIRRILDRFHHADLSTRRYLRHHLDEEFEALQSAYDTLRLQFTDKDK